MFAFRSIMFLVGLCLASQAFCQLSLGLSYQVVLRDQDGKPLPNTGATLEIELLQGSETGPSVYAETHSVTTNDFGLIATVIGSGTNQTGAWADIDWADGPYYFRVIKDGSNMGTQRLESVPYAKIATDMRLDHLKDVVVSTPATNQVLKWNGISWTAAAEGDGSASNEIQTLGLSGNSLTLSNGGGSVSLPVSPWNQSGNHVNYTAGRVGIGTSSPATPLHVQAGSGNLVRLSYSGAGSTEKLLEMQAGANFGGQFLELERGGNQVAQVDADGSAKFKQVTATENLNSNTAPEDGTLYRNGLPLAYGHVSTGGSVLVDYGVDAVTKLVNNPGEYNVKLDKSWVGQPVILVTTWNSNPAVEVATVNPSVGGNNEFNVNISPGDSNFFFVVYGTSQ